MKRCELKRNVKHSQLDENEEILEASGQVLIVKQTKNKDCTEIAYVWRCEIHTK
jgi:hypothetical protein